jgi:hypothetical protein
MQIRKIYKDINATLLYDEVREYVLRQGLILDQNKLETYSMPTDSSSFIYSGTLTFKVKGQEALRAHMVSQDRSETRLLLDSVDELFTQEKAKALEADLDFTLGSFSSK